MHESAGRMQVFTQSGHMHTAKKSPQHSRAIAVHTDGKTEHSGSKTKTKPVNAEEDEHDETRTLHSCPCGWYFIHHCCCSRAGWGCGSRRPRCGVCNAIPWTGLRLGSRLLCRTEMGAGTLGISRLLSSLLWAALLPCALLSSLLRAPLSPSRLRMLPRHPETASHLLQRLI